MKVVQIPIGQMQNFAYVLFDEKTLLAAIVDPAWDLDRILEVVEREGVKVEYVINTHGHRDHVLGNDDAVARTGAKLVAYFSSKVRKDMGVKDGDFIRLGETQIKVYHTPGHADDSICLLADKKLLTGDTLFVGECGRTDLPTSNVHDMYDSLLKIVQFPDDVEVYPGHDYGSKPSSTIGYEKKYNYTLKPRSREEFVKFMATP